MIKKVISFVVPLFTTGLLAHAQQVTPPAYANPSRVNSIRTWDAVKPDTNRNNFVSVTEPTVARMTTQYVDGLGRPVQTVVKKGSLATGGSAADLVNATIYDALGRVVYQYLPFVANNTGGNASLNDGFFKYNPFQQDSAFNKTQFPGETYYYAKTDFEASPLERPTKTFTPGNNWVGGNRGVETKYWFNTVTDSVRIWNVTDVSNDFGTFASSNRYAAGLLYKSVVVDEHGKQVIEFKDKDGQVLLKKVQLTSAVDDGTGKGHPGWLCTYYIYDDRNRLRAVIQPKGVEALVTGSWSLTTTLYNEQCFRYEYDGSGRMCRKKVPGAGEVYMVYDTRDRLVFTQDANMRNNDQWMTTLYDALNRPVLTALMTYDETLQDLQSEVTTQTTVPSSPNTSVPVDLILYNSSTTGTHEALRTITLQDGFETTTSGSFTGEIVAGPAGPDGETTVVESMAVHKNPIPSTATIDILTETYYDNYDWLDHQGNPYVSTRNTDNDGAFLTASNSSYPYPQSLTQSFQTKGMVTGTKTRVLGTSQYLYGISYYDSKGRVIQNWNRNITGWDDVLTTQYSFTGQPLRQYAVSSKNLASPRTEYLITSFEYDDLGRVANIKKTVSSHLGGSNWVSAPETEIVHNQYDALGQLKRKVLAPAYNSNAGLEKQNFEYNIRGWMLGVNRGYIKDDSTNHFGYELGYDKTTNIISGQSYAAAQYNGNITGTTWKSKGDAEKRKYDFTYDAVNRILSADFNQYTSGSFSKSAGVDFSLSGMTYDANGNILSMKQRGLQLTGSVTIDSLSYNYAAGSNKLLNVIDGLNDPATRLGDFRTSTLHPASGSKLTSTEDYEYDDNGNMVKDLNKDIVTYAGTDGIVYNHLNLPQTITVRKSDGNKGTIVYTYDAAGIKLKKTVYEPGVDTTVTLYIGEAILQNDSLQFIAHEEGRVRLVPATTATCTPEDERFIFDYFIKDHLGNVRMVLTEQQEDICYLPATVENAAWQTESQVYDIMDGRRIDKASTGASESSFGNKLYRVHGGNTGEKTGLGMVLKVMSGDQVKITAESYYTLPGGGAGSPLTLGLTELLTAFTGGGPVAAAHGSVSTGTVSGIGANTTSLSNFISDTTAPANTAEAFLNWILFDEQLKYVAGGADPVNTGGGYKEHIKFINSPVNITKNGFLYIYVSNESNFTVFFDNLAVTHTPGVIMEETHYYPWGLTMKGISSKNLANGDIKNKNGYNGNELQNLEFRDEIGLEIYDFNARYYDPQIGRFMQIDPLSDTVDQKQLGPFQFGNNNPIRYSDPSGKCPCLLPILVEAAKAAVAAYIAYKVTEAAQPLINDVVKAIDERRLNTKDNQNSDETGSYTNTYESGKKYHGKGPLQRAEQSAKDKEAAYDDPINDIDWQASENEKEAFKDEAKRIRNDGGVKNPNNYNIRNSPGEKILQQEEKNALLKKIRGF